MRDVLDDGVVLLCKLSKDRGLSDPFKLKGELLFACCRLFNSLVARAGNCDLKIDEEIIKIYYIG